MKLILGRPGRGHRVLEPQGSWLTSTDGGVWATVEELICDVLLLDYDVVHRVLGIIITIIIVIFTIIISYYYHYYCCCCYYLLL